MDLKELAVSVGTTTTTTTTTTITSLLKPTTAIASSISREYLKVLELKEYCKIVESNLKEYDHRVQVLISSKSESDKIKADYKRRNKISFNNSESLFQANIELYEYKCELKSNYIAAEKALRLKKLKYKKIISSYESEWQKALKEFKANPVFGKLQEVEEENIRLETEIKKQENLNSCTEKQFLQLEKYIKCTLLKKIVDFSKVMIKYKELSNLQKPNRKITSLERQKYSENFELAFFRVPSLAPTNTSGSESNDDANCFSNIDVSIFDDFIVPSENLESSHVDEDIYSTFQNKEKSNDVSKDQNGDLESLDKPKQGDQQAKKSLNDTIENSMPSSAKVNMADENESHYFRLQPSECSVHLKNAEGNSEKLKPVSGISEVQLEGVEENEEIYRKRQIQNDDSFSDGSSENQFGNQRGIYECQYRKMSISSDEFPPPAENGNEGSDSPPKLHEEESHLFKVMGPDKTESKSLAGFFTNDSNSPKPFIFKLFET